MEPTAISNGAPTTVPTSQTVEIATNVPPAQTAPKLRVEMDESGRLKGPNSQQFATLTGELVRAHCPVSFLDWRIVPRILKENVWNKLMVYILYCYSSHTSKAQTLQANLATSVMAAKGARMDEIELERTTQRITKIVLQAMRDQQKNQHSSSYGDQPENHPVATGEQQHNQHHQAMGEEHRNEHATNNQSIPNVQRTTVPIPNHGSNIDLAGIENPLDGVQFVHLFNRKRLTVATGYVVYGKEGERCHTVQVLADERKIRLKSIYDGDCQVPDAPQGDDRNHLWEYTANECLIWPVSRMEFMNE
ncbi:hypothetical protein MKW92_045402 [Papaver armeniacum]|nr:hypothetical protein MKW92_045402 [Papaver armeniacum]